MKGGDLKEKLAEVSGDSERPFLSEEVWAIFAAYRSVLVFCYARIEVLAAGLEDSEQMFSNDKIVDLVKTVLPTHVAFLDQYGIVGVAHTVDTLQERLLVALRQSLSGIAMDKEGVEQAARILDLVGEVESALAQQEVLPRS